MSLTCSKENSKKGVFGLRKESFSAKSDKRSPNCNEGAGVTDLGSSPKKTFLEGRFPYY